jgi:UDP-N-acetylmuramoyl-tripeptide--D-alanyl-D-alanine ligase
LISLTLAEIAAAVQGTLILGESGATAETIVSGEAQTDSREVQAGEIFFAKRGEETDGHLFVGSAVANGAALLVVEEETDPRVPQIVVGDTVVALGALATEVIRRVQLLGRLRTVGITGSNGKTTTKNLLAAMTGAVGETVAPVKSFNNEVGAPLTMLKVTEQTDFLVAEMGASREGDIDRLVRMAHPNIGIVLCVGLAHAGEFGGIEATFRAKSEMVTCLTADDVAVLNREDPRVVKMAELTKAKILWFGLTDSCDVWADDIDSDSSGTRFTLHVGGEAAPVRFQVLGEHHVMNALAAASAARALGIPLNAIVAALESATRAERWRMELLSSDPVTVINDAYNASPDSMAAALKTLAQIGQHGGRTFAVLGEMSELGEFSGAEHDRIGLLAVRLNISRIVVVGEGARRLHISTINEGSWDGESVYFEQQDDAYDYLVNELNPGDTILFKSSNSAGLRFLGDRLGEYYS